MRAPQAPPKRRQPASRPAPIAPTIGLSPEPLSLPLSPEGSEDPAPDACVAEDLDPSLARPAGDLDSAGALELPGAWGAKRSKRDPAPPPPGEPGGTAGDSRAWEGDTVDGGMPPDSGRLVAGAISDLGSRAGAAIGKYLSLAATRVSPVTQIGVWSLLRE